MYLELTNTKKHSGYSSTLTYKKDGLCISRGRCNHYNDSTRIINISISLPGDGSIHIALWEDARFYDSILKLLESPKRSDSKILKQVWKVVASLGNPKECFEAVFESGRKHGRREKVEEINEVLSRE